MKRPATLTLRVRPTLAVAGVLTAALLGACSTQSPLQTTVPYQPADGIAASSGVVEARDLLVVSDKKDAPGVLSGSIINTSAEPVTVSFMDQETAASGGKGTAIKLKAREQMRIETVQFASVPKAPGDMTSIVMQTTAGQTMVSVPVLLPDGPYATVTPTAPASATTAAG